ncbi:putative thiamine pyrophosphate-containing protein YdaP [Paraliobacillus ryukyuensis]|uniref:Pyruvate oxidase n=1 Tax=Paraliobacillus ryukyuensis TaxID=200904 RepID=A0A366E5M8_9BACI|nr:pyruvate oxidase [Paraliobacillus ryukyuensis]RBO97089.1 pyruvate oxidase [Paraliobacillus ryukyuensis]
MKAAEAVIEIMKDWDVSHIYGYPGDSVNNLVEAFRNHQEEISFIQVRHEEVASLAASAEAKLTNKVGVCLSIGGPGAIHLLNGMYDAKADGAPLVVITGQISHDLVGTDNFQEVNLERMFDDVSVFHRRVTSGKQMRPLLEQAFKDAYTYNGVAVLSVPDDVFKENVEHPQLRSSTFKKPALRADKEDLQKAANEIKRANKPLILAGKGAMGTRDELIQFGENIAAPIIVSLRGKGVIPDEHPLNLGNLGQIGTKPAFEAMEETDLLIMVGTSFPYRDFLPDDVKAIQIDIDSAQIGKRYPVDIGLVASSVEVLQWFNKHISEKEDRVFLRACQENMKSWWNHLDDIVQPRENKPMQGPQVIHTLQDYVEDDAILSVDVGNVSTWTARFFKMTNQQLVISSWLATMGCGLPGAIASKLKQPEKQVVAICGDGGFAMVMQDFLTAVKYNLPITVIILNNSKLGMIKYEQEQIGNISYGTALQGFDFAKFAEACGGIGFHVTNEDTLSEALESASKIEKPTIIDVEIEDRAPLPGKIEWGQAMGYSKYLLKKLIERDTEWDMPSLKTVLKRMF